MSTNLNVKIQGLTEAMNVLKALGPRYTDGVSRLMTRFAEERVVKFAKEEFVPVMFGHLRDSIKASPPIVDGDEVHLVVTAGDASIKYAARVHENPRAGMTQGVSPSGKKYRNWSRVGQWKYLETPALIAAQNSKVWLQREATSVIFDLNRGEK
jgi:membrane-bound inhibitor of C-type lysozyme